MVLNGLKFINSRLSRPPSFQDKPVAQLLGAGVSPELKGKEHHHVRFIRILDFLI